MEGVADRRVLGAVRSQRTLNSPSSHQASHRRGDGGLTGAGLVQKFAVENCGRDHMVGPYNLFVMSSPYCPALKPFKGALQT